MTDRIHCRAPSACQAKGQGHCRACCMAKVRTLAGGDDAARLAKLRTPESRAAARERMRMRWADPAFRARISEAHRWRCEAERASGVMDIRLAKMRAAKAEATPGRPRSERAEARSAAQQAQRRIERVTRAAGFTPAGAARERVAELLGQGMAPEAVLARVRGEFRRV
jgi:hypothetical protein